MQNRRFHKNEKTIGINCFRAGHADVGIGTIIFTAERQPGKFNRDSEYVAGKPGHLARVTSGYLVCANAFIGCCGSNRSAK